MTTQEKAAIEIMAVVAQVIKELGSVPSGHLYARLMGHMSLETYERVISAIVKTGMVERRNHLLTWRG